MWIRIIFILRLKIKGVKNALSNVYKIHFLLFRCSTPLLKPPPIEGAVYFV